MRESLYSEKLKNRRVRCLICRRCCVIDEGGYGYCHTRANKGGTLYTLAYGRVSTLQNAPIEAKPLFHFYPGSRWLSVGTLGCNFLCPGCQNWETAHERFHLDVSLTEERLLQTITPQRLVSLAKQKQCAGISFTYNEPAVWFEYALDCARLAKKQRLLVNWVTNGFISKAALDEIGPFLDAYRVDIKGFSPEVYRITAHISGFEGILEVTERAKRGWNCHIEIVTNVIPGCNDSDEELRRIARWIVTALGPDTPWHVTRFVPRHDLSHLDATPVVTLERARRIGLNLGLRYVYIGNVPGHSAQNTYCPGCGSLLIERDAFTVKRICLDSGKCPKCSAEVFGRWY
jgi:pyruvate formate lyase activating enzyme